MRLINADDLIDIIAARINPARHEMFNKFMQKFIDVVKAMPTVDAEPVRHDVWNPVYGERTEKSFGDIVLKEYACSNCLHREKEKTRYCSECGAKMDGEE